MPCMASTWLRTAGRTSGMSLRLRLTVAHEERSLQERMTCDACGTVVQVETDGRFAGYSLQSPTNSSSKPELVGA